MAFPGNDPLSELVWSPRKGLVLRPADGSVPGGKSSNFLGAGYSEMVHSQPYSIATESNDDNVTKERNLIVLPTISPVEKDVADEPAILLTASKNFASNMQMCKSDIGCYPGSGEKTAEMNTSSQKSYARDSTVAPNSLREEGTARFEATGSNSQGLEDGRTSNVIPVSDELDLNTKPVEYMPGGLTDMEMCGPLDMNKDSSQTCPLPPVKGNFLQEVQDLRKSNVADALMLNPSSSRCKELVRSNDCLMKDGGNKMIGTASAKYKWQSPSDSDLGIRNSSQAGKEQFQLEACSVSKASPIKYFTTKRKGKEHAMSGGSIKEQDSDSYGSVNSCNTAGLFGGRKRRELSFEEQLIAGSKRVKLDLQEAPGSTSFTRSDGSFVNWISTLMKGLSRPDENKAPSLADASNGSEKKELIACSRVQYHKCGNMGFQSIFESLYQPNSKEQDQRLSSSVDPYVSEGCKELEAVEKSIENNNVRTSSLDDRVDLEQKGMSYENLNQCMSGDERDPLVVASVPFDRKTSESPKRFPSTQNYAMAEHVGCSKKLSAGKWKTDDLSLEGKKVDESVKKYSQHSHLWLTHFCPKPSGLIMNLANHERRTAGVGESSAEVSRFGHNRQDNVVCFMDGKDTASQGHSSKGPTNSFCKKLHGSFLEAEASCAMKRIEGRRVSPIKPSSRFKSSEAMVSIFAKRLDSLKQIMQADMAEKTTSSATTCFFCGVIGHGLRDCPQVTDTEVDELINDITTRSGAEESPCFCIRCFQLNHWAVACPNAPTVKESQLEHVAAVLNRTFLAETPHLELPGGTHGQSGIPRLKASYTSSPPRMSTGLNVNLEINETSASLRRISPNLEKFSASCVEESASEAPYLPHPYYSFGRQVVDKPRGIFEAVKNLRLSRTDILKYMYSMVPISYLDGYYLRLRLGKPGEGIEGTGYHVACISDLHGDKSVETSKRPISVIVGGVRCSVESQYISNRDFLEDELTAWWSVTIKGGGKIPSEEELRSKIEERRSLGL